MKNFLVRAKSKLAFCFFFAFNELCFAANPLTEFKSKVDSELNETMKTIMGMANTVTMTIGIVWLVILFLFMKGSPERFKENMKGIIIVSVIIAIAYGITYAYKWEQKGKAMLETYCHRELTKKTKSKGLTTNSWLMLAFLGGFLWFFFVFYSIPMILLLYIAFWLLEYFDEDIYTIVNVKSKIKAKKYYA